MTQIKEISFQATFLIPAYDLVDKTRFVTTQNAYSIDGNGFKSINVWLIQAVKGQETESILKSLRQEQLNNEHEIRETKKAANLSPDEKDKRIRFFRHYAKLMKTYIKEYNRGDMQHEPDPEFVDIAKNSLRAINCNIDNAIYLCGITHLTCR